MKPSRVTFSAALSRFVFALVGAGVFPILYPGFGAHRWVFVFYMALALLAQVLIWKEIGGVWRAAAWGVLDMVMITFMVHRMGSTMSMLVSLYFFAAIVNVLVAGRRVGMFLAWTGALLYAGVLGGESMGLLPYGPDAPRWAEGAAPSPSEALVTSGLVTALLLMATAIVGELVDTAGRREAALRDANQKLEALSQRDPLTQLFNRRYLLERMEEELAWARRGRPFAVVMIDLDRFKAVNDHHGHLRGDALLQELARSLETSVRATDVASRYGGDEFVLVLPGSGQEEAEAAARRVAEAVRRIGTAFDPERPVTASVGVALAQPDDDPRSVLRRADEASYTAKNEGGDRVKSEAPTPPRGDE